MSNDNNMNTKDFLIGALVGGIVGAASALLLAPKSGKELREDLNIQAQTAKEKTSEITQTALERSSKYANLAKEKSSTLAKTVSEQSSQIIGRVKELTDSVKKDVEELSQSADDLTNDFEDGGIEIANTVKTEVAALHEEVLEKDTDEEADPIKA